MLPTFLGIGAPKSATTWLFHCLQEHPEIFVAEVKETDYFTWRFNLTPRSDYERHFDAVTDESAVGEISTSYLHSCSAPERAYAVLPGARLFVSLRNPVDQVYSHFWHLLRQNFHQSQRSRPGSFEQALDMYPDRLLGTACYHEHLSRWLDYYDASQLHIILYSDISDLPGQTLRKLFGFLGVDESFCPSFLDEKGRSVRKGSAPRGRLWETLYNTLYDFLTSYAYTPLRRLIGDHRAERIKNALQVREGMEALFRSKGYPEMRSQTRRELRNYFAVDIQRLECLIERDLQHWK